MRHGNWEYRLPFAEGQVAYLVHRGVSQGGRKLTPEARERYWRKHRRQCGTGERVRETTHRISVDLSAVIEWNLTIMRRFGLVIVTNPARPEIWTVARIRREAARVDYLAALALAEAVVPTVRRRNLRTL